MNEQTVRNWILKANNDLKIAKDEIITTDPATDAVCFHAQQCSEKYLKAYLSFCDKPVLKTHNLSRIVQTCVEKDSDFVVLFEKGIDDLTSYAIEVRYPDDFYFPSAEEAALAIQTAEFVKEFIRKKLSGLGFILE